MTIDNSFTQNFSSQSEVSDAPTSFSSSHQTIPQKLSKTENLKNNSTRDNNVSPLPFFEEKSPYALPHNDSKTPNEFDSIFNRMNKIHIMIDGLKNNSLEKENTEENIPVAEKTDSEKFQEKKQLLQNQANTLSLKRRVLGAGMSLFSMKTEALKEKFEKP